MVCQSSPSRRSVLVRPVLGSIGLVKATGTDYSNNFNFPHTQSFDAINLLKSVAPGHSGDTEQIVFGTSGDARLTDTAVGLRINKMVEEIKKLPNVSVVASPYDDAGNLVDTSDINDDRTVGSSRSTSTSSPTTSRTPKPRQFMAIGTGDLG